MRPAREDIITSAHALTHELPLRLRTLYPVSQRAMLQSLRIDELTVHDRDGKDRRIALPRTLGRFSRRAPAIPVEGLGDPLPEEASAFSLVLDYIHDPEAYGMPTILYGIKVRLRYDIANDRLEGSIGYWPSPLPDGEDDPLPSPPVSAIFQLGYVVPY